MCKTPFDVRGKRSGSTEKLMVAFQLALFLAALDMVRALIYPSFGFY